MLHIKQIEMKQFATHDASRVNLPERGLVAVTGPNGSGKSTMIEAVATGLWGESLRGELGWRAGIAGEVTIQTDGVAVTRKRSKAGASKVEWNEQGRESVAYETATKAQTALEVLVGSYEVWRRTCVLSSLDSAAFSLARDVDRKRLLEEFLGLEMFDAGLTAARADLKAATAKASAASSLVRDLTQRRSFADSQLRQAQEDAAVSSAEARPVADVRADLDRVSGLLKGAQQDASEASARAQQVARTVRELEQAGASVDAEARAEMARLSRLRDDQCPTCGQGVADVRAHISQEVADLRQKADAQRAAVSAQLASARADHAAALEEAEELASEARALSAKAQALQADLRVSEAAAKRTAALESRRAEAQAAFDKADGQLGKATEDAATTAREVEYLEAVERVLGLRGVRAQVLDRALGALEQTANAWLSRMPTAQGALVLTLSGSTTQKTGTVVDAISLRVGGRAYASCSGGERRRVDVALLLALRELAVAAHGRDGTIWADEVFDALDVQGVQDAAAALREMASDRLVVVVTHSPDLLAALRPDVRISLALDGEKSVVKAA